MVRILSEGRTHKLGRVGSAQNEMSGNGQIQGYRWLRHCTIKRMYVVSQGS